MIEVCIVFIFKEKLFRKRLGTACLEQNHFIGWIWIQVLVQCDEEGREL